MAEGGTGGGALSVSRRRAPQGRGIEALEIRNLLSVTGGTGTFADGVQVNDAPVGLSGVALADLDGDGDLDAFGVSGSKNVFVNDGAGGFTLRQSLGGSNARGADLGDIDGDGDLDAFVANSSRDGSPAIPNEVWLNDGTGTFTDSGQRLGAANSASVKLGDLDGDGDLDAVVVSENNEPHEVWLNDGTGIFADSSQRLSAIGGGFAVALGDVDGDGDLDAVVAGGGFASAVWRNDGGANFTNHGRLPNASPSLPGTHDVALGDVDGDGDLDALVGTYGGQGSFILTNDGSGNFQESQQFTPGSSDTESYGVALGDLDGDGDLDAFIANKDESGNRIYLNDGLGTFVPTAQVLTNTGNAGFGNRGNYDVELGDLDGDGDWDAFVANPGLSGSQVFLNDNTPHPEVMLPTGGGNYELLLSGDDLVLRHQGGSELLRQPLNDATQLIIRGSEADDKLTVSLSSGNPIRAGGITFLGGAGNEQLVLSGGSATNLTHRFSNATDGRASADGRTINHVGAESISDQLTVARRTFKFSDGNDNVTLSDSGTTNDEVSRFTIQSGVTLEFKRPSNSFTIRAGAGDDIITLSSVDTRLTRVPALFGDDGNDVLMGLMTRDSLDGGAGHDLLNGRGGNDTVIGGDGRDTLVGGAGHDSLAGGSDNDKLNGQGGHDSLNGGAGNDVLSGDAGHDSLAGGDGNDTLRGDDGHDTLLGEAGLDLLAGGAGNDRLDGGADNDYLKGEDGNDSLLGSSGQDVLLGGVGRDTLKGGDGDDSLLGGSNDDVLLGGLDNDSLDGGLGADTLAGNDDEDVIVGLASEIDEAFSA